MGEGGKQYNKDKGPEIPYGTGDFFKRLDKIDQQEQLRDKNEPTDQTKETVLDWATKILKEIKKEIDDSGEKMSEAERNKSMDKMDWITDLYEAIGGDKIIKDEKGQAIIKFVPKEVIDKEVAGKDTRLAALGFLQEIAESIRGKLSEEEKEGLSEKEVEIYDKLEEDDKKLYEARIDLAKIISGRNLEKEIKDKYPTLKETDIRSLIEKEIRKTIAETSKKENPQENP